MYYKSRAGVIIVGLFLLTTSLCSAQGKIRTLDEGLQYENSPIKIVRKELAEKPFLDDTRVLAGREWLKDLLLTVKNVSSKSILSFDIDLLVKENGKILMGIPVNFRTELVPTEASARTLDGKVKIGVLEPGEVVKVRVTNRAMLAFGNELLRRGIEDLEQVTLDLRFVYFDDNTRWIMGQEGPVPPAKPIGGAGHPSSSKLRSLLNPEINRCSSGVSFAFATPATSRFFLETLMAAASPPSPPTCVWLVNSELRQEGCIFVPSANCQGDDRLCAFDDYDGAVRSTDPGGGALKGYMNFEPDLCESGPVTPPGVTCSTCQTFNQNVFRADTQCGQPGSCAQLATWGCESGLVNINGVCQRPVSYQQTCGNGYDSLSCTCNDCTFDQFWECTQIHGTWYGYPFCFCDSGSPIVIDTNGDGFRLTSASNGVDFDLNSSGVAERLAWTSANSDDAWLALDRNGDGVINNGRELFGNFTPQPDPPVGTIKNGFLALAEYDKVQNGGNNDGLISRRDLIFGQLRLWFDLNHNGISEESELKPIADVGLRKINLDYQESRRVDAHGNRFMFRSKIRDAQDAQLGRWAWDVFLVVEP